MTDNASSEAAGSGWATAPSILQEASELINGQRAQDYGPVTENFERIADLWNSYLGISAIDHYDVANLMILVKLARVRNAGYHRDSYADIAGYAALAEKVYDEIETGQAISDYIATGKTEPVSDDFWAGVDQSIVEAQEKRERDRTSRPPRVWESIKDIPEGVVARDSGAGWFWKVSGSQSASSTKGKHWSDFQEFYPSEDDYGPFTEVLDTEQKGSK